MEDVKIIPIDATELLSVEKVHLDTQIVTAKQYPRSVKVAVQASVDIATMSGKIAESCAYALPRAGKFLLGPSVHLARIIAQNWTNIRVESKVVEITSTEVVSQSVCWDLQTNYAVKIDVRKSIIDSYGRKYNQSMITVTGNAANAVSFRNSVFSVIPRHVSETVLQAAKDKMTGDLSDDSKLDAKRNKSIKFFKDNYGATEEQILKAVGVKEIEDIRQDQIVIMIGLAQSIKDGDSKPEEIFKGIKPKKKTGAEKKDDLKKDTKNPNSGMA